MHEFDIATHAEIMPIAFRSCFKICQVFSHSYFHSMQRGSNIQNITHKSCIVVGKKFNEFRLL